MRICDSVFCMALFRGKHCSIYYGALLTVPLPLFLILCPGLGSAFCILSVLCTCFSRQTWDLGSTIFKTLKRSPPSTLDRVPQIGVKLWRGGNKIWSTIDGILHCWIAEIDEILNWDNICDKFAMFEMCIKVWTTVRSVGSILERRHAALLHKEFWKSGW